MKRESVVNIYRNKTCDEEKNLREKDDELLQDGQRTSSEGTERFEEERWREKHCSKERNKDTECRRHWRLTLEREVSRCSILLLHLLTDNLTNLVGFAAVFILRRPPLICVSSVTDARWCEDVNSSVQEAPLEVCLLL